MDINVTSHNQLIVNFKGLEVRYEVFTDSFIKFIGVVLDRFVCRTYGDYSDDFLIKIIEHTPNSSSVTSQGNSHRV